jgi:copper chaperone CopZ
MTEKTVHIPAMHCAHCLATIRREVAELAGVRKVEGDPRSKQVTIAFEAPADWESIAQLLRDLGYPPES